MLVLAARSFRQAALVGGLAVVLALLGGAASASAAWQSPQAIDNGASSFGATNAQTALASGPGGLTAALFFQPPATPSGAPPTPFMARRPGGIGAWSSPAAIATPSGQVAGIPQPALAIAPGGPFGSGGALGLFGFQTSGGSGAVASAAWPAGAAGPADAVVMLCTSGATPECAATSGAPARVAFDGSGIAYAVGAVLASGDVLLARTDSSGSWQPAQIVGQGSFPQVAVDPAGDVVVTYVRTDNTIPINPVNRMYARRALAGQASFSSEDQISGSGSVSEANNPFALVIDPSGTATAVFIDQPTPVTNAVEAVSWPLSIANPAPEQRISGAPQTQGPQPGNATAVVDPQGDVTAAWDAQSPNDTVYAAQLIGGIWQASEQVSPNDGRGANRPQLAADAAGTVTLVYTDGTPPTNSDLDVKATRLPLGGAWSMPVSLRSTDPSAGAVQTGSARVAASSTGQADATFIQQLGGTNRLLATRFGDTTPPSIQVVTPQDGATYRQGATVLSDYSCADEAGGSGLASCSGTVLAGRAIDTSSAGTKAFTVSASDKAGNSASKTVHYVVRPGPAPTDRTPPRITLRVPRNGAVYTKGQRVNASFSCADPDSRVSVCRGTVANRHAINTRTLGRHSFSVIAQDPAGNTSSKTVHYSVRLTPRFAKIRLKVAPRRVLAGHRVRLRFRATFCLAGRCAGLRRVAISFHGIIRRTNARGYATFVVVLRRPGRYPAFARQRGYLPGKTVVIVHRPRRRK